MKPWPQKASLVASADDSTLLCEDKLRKIHFGLFVTHDVELGFTKTMKAFKKLLTTLKNVC